MSTQTEKETKEPLKMKKKVGRPKKYTEQTDRDWETRSHTGIS